MAVPRVDAMAVLWFGVLGCTGGFRPELAPSTAYRIDSTLATRVEDGVLHRTLFLGEGPWVAHVLEVTLDRCTSLEAVKGFAGAIGRERTSVLLGRLDDTVRVLGGVNADFFLFTPPGVPTNAHVQRGVVTTGPNAQPVLAIARDGVPSVGPLQVRGEAVFGGARHQVVAWNRAAPTGLAVFDRSWGAVLDTATATIEVLLSADADRRVVHLDTTTAGMRQPPGTVTLVAGRDAPASLRAALLALAPGDPVALEVSLGPGTPWHAVGGRPIVLEDGVITRAARDSGSFSVTRHPRTAVGLADGGRRVLLVVVDGRQPGWSAGMSLPELAELLRQLGAREGINLDGGGSSALVVRRGGDLVVANRPSDPQGERPVANALAVVRRC